MVALGLPGAYAEWFANCDWRLRSAERFDSLSEIVAGSASAPDSMFRLVMERLRDVVPEVSEALSLTGLT